MNTCKSCSPLIDLLNHLNRLQDDVYSCQPREVGPAVLYVNGKALEIFRSTEAAALHVAELIEQWQHSRLLGSYARTDYAALALDAVMIEHLHQILEPLAYLYRSGINPGSLLSLDLSPRDPAARIFAPLLVGSPLLREIPDQHLVSIDVPAAMIAMVEAYRPIKHFQDITNPHIRNNPLDPIDTA